MSCCGRCKLCRHEWEELEQERDAAQAEAARLRGMIAAVTSDESVTRAIDLIRIRGTPTGCMYVHRDDVRAALAAAIDGKVAP